MVLTKYHNSNKRFYENKIFKQSLTESNSNLYTNTWSKSFTTSIMQTQEYEIRPSQGLHGAEN